MTILITGISGFLGSNLVKHLSFNHPIVGISGKSNMSNFDGIKKVYNYTSDFEKIEEKPEIIILCHASISSGSTNAKSKELYDANVAFTEKVISAFPNSKFIYISSVSVYSELNELKTELSPVCPISEYAISKYWAERKVLTLEKCCVIRFPSLYGKEMKENTLNHYM